MVAEKILCRGCKNCGEIDEVQGRITVLCHSGATPETVEPVIKKKGMRYEHCPRRLPPVTVADCRTTAFLRKLAFFARQEGVSSIEDVAPIEARLRLQIDN